MSLYSCKFAYITSASCLHAFACYFKYALSCSSVWHRRVSVCLKNLGGSECLPLGCLVRPRRDIMSCMKVIPCMSVQRRINCKAIHFCNLFLICWGQELLSPPMAKRRGVWLWLRADSRPVSTCLHLDICWGLHRLDPACAVQCSQSFYEFSLVLFPDVVTGLIWSDFPWKLSYILSLWSLSDSSSRFGACHV